MKYFISVSTGVEIVDIIFYLLTLFELIGIVFIVLIYCKFRKKSQLQKNLSFIDLSLNLIYFQYQ